MGRTSVFTCFIAATSSWSRCPPPCACPSGAACPPPASPGSGPLPGGGGDGCVLSCRTRPELALPLWANSMRCGVANV